MSLNIPLDVVENVIDILVQDDPNLSSIKACSLVSRAFLSICRKHIFGSVNLTSEQPIYPFGPPIIERQSPRIPIRTFIRVLAASPVLFHYIRNLKYWMAYKDLYDPALPETLKQLNRLQSASILHGSNYVHAYTPWIQLRPIFLNILSIPSLEELTISGITNFILADLALCRNLAVFKFNTVTFSVAPSDVFPSPLTIHSLEVGSHGIGPSPVAPLQDPQCADGRPFINFSCLSHLSVVVLTGKDSDNCRSLLQMCEQLISVKITMQGLGDRNNPVKISFGLICLADLTSISTLKHLSIHAAIHPHADFTDLYLGLHDQLEEMGNRNVVEMISIMVSVIGTISTDPIAEEKWDRLDKVLGSSGWPWLRRVSLSVRIYREGGDDDDNLNIVEELKRMSKVQFPRLLSRKGLQFNFFAEPTDSKSLNS